jgi:hypothetical protein
MNNNWQGTFESLDTYIKGLKNPKKSRFYNEWLAGGGQSLNTAFGGKQAFENRPTSNISKELEANPELVEIAKLLPLQEEIKTVGLSLFERLNASGRIDGFNNPLTEDEIKKVLEYTGFKESEDSPGFYIKGNLQTRFRTYSEREDYYTFSLKKKIFRFNSASTDPQYDCYCDYEREGKDGLRSLCSQLESVLGEHGLRDEVKRIEKANYEYGEKLKEAKRESQLNNLDKDKYLGPSKFWDMMRKIEDGNKIKQVNLRYGLAGFRLDEKFQTLLIVDDNPARGYGLGYDERRKIPAKVLSIWRAKEGKGYQVEGYMPMTKDSVEQALADSSYESLKSKYIKGGDYKKMRDEKG